ncbi:MAG TPA: SOS response-associated peptidase [Pseudolysinimonas sp.]|nr:SOS response-associated peptidase [Pseudolysinimonas sp.]
MVVNGRLAGMCGRFALDEKTDNLIRAFVADGNNFADWEPRYSIAPTEIAPIVRERRSSDSGEVSRTIDPAVWDFHPAFMRDSKRPQFNARIETVATNGLWKAAFAKSRCIVPMRGYYEWTEIEEDGKQLKQPHFIHGSSPVLSAAGIYTARKVEGEWVVSTAIITRQAKDASGEIHDRMPAFLNPELWDEWLNPEPLATDAEREHALSLLEVVSDQVASTITTHEVDRRVNNSRTLDPLDPVLIEPIAR